MPKLALLGGAPTRPEAYPQWPEFDERDTQIVAEVVRSGNWGGYPYPGPYTQRFIQGFTEMQGGGYPVVMMNGTVTMEVACRAAGIGWGDEVLVPAMTFQATATAPMAAGAIPVIVDVDPENYCMDPRKAEAAITPRTRGILPVHLGAQVTDMDAIMALAEKYNLVVIEDCAHAHGAKWNGRGVGTIGHFGSFSLQSSKILTTGEGGVLLCRTQELADKAASIINCGRKMGDQGPMMGANYRLPEIQAALGVVALERFPEQVKQRAEALGYLEESLSEVAGVRMLRRDPRHTTRSFYRYGFAVDINQFGGHKYGLLMALEAEGIPAEWGYEPMNHYSLFNPLNSHLPTPSAFPERFNMAAYSLPEAERACQQDSVWLDECVFRAGQQGVDDVIKALRKVQDERADLEVWVQEQKKAHGMA
jgi:dTDP-4-amino-4,6-dideoxygalactose transaminase